MRSFLVVMVAVLAGMASVGLTADEGGAVIVSGGWQQLQPLAAGGGGGVVLNGGLAQALPLQPAATPAVGEDATPAAGRRLNRQERRRLGITLRNVRRVMADLEAAGELDQGDAAGTAAQVLSRLIDEQPQQYKQLAGDIDWDRVLEFIEKLVELLLKIIPLFT